MNAERMQRRDEDHEEPPPDPGAEGLPHRWQILGLTRPERLTDPDRLHLAEVCALGLMQLHCRDPIEAMLELVANDLDTLTFLMSERSSFAPVLVDTLAGLMRRVRVAILMLRMADRIEKRQRP